MKSFRSYPILLLTVPLAGGIFLSDTFFSSNNNLLLHVGILAILTFALWVSVVIHSFRFRWLFGTFLFFWLIMFGSVLVQYHRLKTVHTWSAVRQIYHGIVLDTPRERAKTICCRMSVEDSEVLVYFMKDSLSRRIVPYERLTFYTQLSMPENMQRTSRFDYPRWLRRNGITGTGVVYRGEWTNHGTINHPSFRQYAMLCRTNILHTIHQWGLKEEQGLITSLAVGYKDELTDEQRSHFSQAGVSHVLSLSGLHVGILWGILIFILSPLRKRMSGRVVSWFVSTIVLWAYAFITGLAPSVVRAVAMCMLVDLGRIRCSRVSTINILSAVAGGMLIYRPYYLYDVGFQLSFMAVLAICVCYRPLCSLVKRSNPLLTSVWKILCISFSAQLGTAPLIAIYFGSFPVYFLVANLLVTPLIPFILYLTLICLITSVIPCVQSVFLWFLHVLSQIVISLTTYISQLPFSSIRLTSVSPWGIVWIYLFLASVILSLSLRKRQNIFVMLIVIWLGSVGMVISRVYCC